MPEDTILLRFAVDARNLDEAFSRVRKHLETLSKSANKVNASAKGLNRQVRTINQTTARAVHTQTRFTDALRRANSQIGVLTSSFRRASASITAGNDSIDMLAHRLDAASMMMWKFTMSVIPLRQVTYQALGVVVGLGAALGKTIEIANRIETSRVIFRRITGSAEAAQKSVDFLMSMAPKIRGTIDQVLDAGRVLAVAGYDIRKLIMPMADLAAGINQQGISISDAARAFVDAMHGEFRRLRNTFDITKEEVMAFAPGAINALGQVVDRAKLQFGILEAIQKKYGGINKATWTTVGYLWSNVHDQFVRMLDTFGQPLLDILRKVLPPLQDFLTTLTKIVAGPLGKLAAYVSVGTLLAAGIGAVVAATTMLYVQIKGLIAMYNVWRQTGGSLYKNLFEQKMQLLQLTRLLNEEESKGVHQQIRNSLVLLETEKTRRRFEEGLIRQAPREELVGHARRLKALEQLQEYYKAPDRLLAVLMEQELLNQKISKSAEKELSLRFRLASYIERENALLAKSAELQQQAQTSVEGSALAWQKRAAIEERLQRAQARRIAFEEKLRGVVEGRREAEQQLVMLRQEEMKLRGIMADLEQAGTAPISQARDALKDRAMQEHRLIELMQQRLVIERQDTAEVERQVALERQRITSALRGREAAAPTVTAEGATILATRGRYTISVREGLIRLGRAIRRGVVYFNTQVVEGVMRIRSAFIRLGRGIVVAVRAVGAQAVALARQFGGMAIQMAVFAGVMWAVSKAINYFNDAADKLKDTVSKVSGRVDELTNKVIDITPSQKAYIEGLEKQANILADVARTHAWEYLVG